MPKKEIENKFDQTPKKQTKFQPFKKARTAVNGLSWVLVHDISVTQKIILTILTVGVSLFLGKNLNLAIILLATSQMLTAEFFNTCVELICDMVQPNYSEKVKAIKDVAATAVSISIWVWVLVLGWEYYQLISNYHFS